MNKVLHAFAFLFLISLVVVSALLYGVISLCQGYEILYIMIYYTIINYWNNLSIIISIDRALININNKSNNIAINKTITILAIANSIG